MAVYTVHEPPRRADDTLAYTERFAFVRDGFSFPAFLFGPLWMLRHRLWLALIGYVLVAIAFGAAVWAAGAGGVFVWLLLSILVGLEAPSLRRFALHRRGWRTVGIVVGDDLEAAERRFFDSWAAGEHQRRSGSPTPPPAPGPAREPAGIVGLFPEPGARA